MRPRYLLQSRDREADLVRIAPVLRHQVRFGRVNLVDDDWGVAKPVDVIFCRNVFIYFDRVTQEEILQRFARLLTPGGYLFVGHAEALNGFDVPFRPVGPTTYRTPGPAGGGTR